MRRKILPAVLAVALLSPSLALAWGREGHAVVATMAYGMLTPKAAKAVDALLASDPDTLTSPDLGARASWADAYRQGHRQTTGWHFVNTELDDGDLAKACANFPTSQTPASAGPANDCVVGRLKAFEAELADPATDPAERLLAFKFVLHLVGDLHQPLHAADNHDKGGNCALLSLGGQRTVNLHAYWDTVLVEAIDPDAGRLARMLAASITPAQRKAWSKGEPADWAMEAFGQAKSVAYTLGSAPACASDTAPLALPPGHEDRAKVVVEAQLRRAAVRLALLLERALG